MQTRRPLFVSGTPQPTEDSSPDQALRSAVTDRNMALAEFMLLRNDVNPNHSDGRTVPLMIASWNGDLPMLQLLLKFGARADAPSPDPNYPSLLAACFTPQVPPDIISALVNAGAVDLPATRPQHRTLLELAAESGRLDLLAVMDRALSIRHLEGSPESKV